ncbi:DUF3455 domain-containing protein [Bordetella genomosp. 12]|uniref:DUF3455 domain-containing protein n=1 Tax=Bordetella genomosp. 12 TaxID=463035 RepID=A0A261VBH2_9BORD|nr:DUF3455 domain-containing protein [Bordetella genomosp. 12]OZI70902.1 hypothetical protein CAL22_13455 [Bordetella genomosp. 12]
MTPTLHHRRHTFGLIVAALLATASSGAQAADPVPPLMQVPAGNYVAWRTTAQGVVHYQCQAATGTPAWAIASSQAKLTGTAGSPNGNYTSPPETWTAADGSSVTGMEVVRVRSGNDQLYDQLVMANPVQGAGVLVRVTYIQRLVSAGGGIPAAACDNSRLGQGADSPFKAEYVFWAPN